MSRQCPSCYLWESRRQEESIRPLSDQVCSQPPCTTALIPRQCPEGTNAAESMRPDYASAMEGIVTRQPADSQALGTLRWWAEYSDRKNDEGDEHVSDSLLYDR